jgi:N-acetylneuraminate lyase
MQTERPLFEGILPAVVTPFDAEMRFAPAAFEALLERLFATGVHGVYVCGNTGEGGRQPVAQRKLVTEAAVRCTPRGKAVVIHVGGCPLADAIELARHAARAQAHAVSSLPPAGEDDPRAILEYYRALAAASELPLVVYYFPDICPAIRSRELVFDLVSLPNVVGLKFTDFNLYLLAQLRRQGVVVFNGRDEVLLAGLLMCASGGIGSFYNLAPELFLRVWELSRRQAWEEARPVQQQINELVEIVLRYPQFPAIKKILAWSGLNCGECLPPDPRLSAGQEANLRRDLCGSSLGTQSFAGFRLT